MFKIFLSAFFLSFIAFASTTLDAQESEKFIAHIKDDNVDALKEVLEKKLEFQEDSHNYLAHLHLQWKPSGRRIAYEHFLTIVASFGGKNILNYLQSERIFPLDSYQFDHFSKNFDSLLTKSIEKSNLDFIKYAVSSIDLNEFDNLIKFIDCIMRFAYYHSAWLDAILEKKLIKSSGLFKFREYILLFFVQYSVHSSAPKYLIEWCRSYLKKLSHDDLLDAMTQILQSKILNKIKYEE